MHDALTIGIPLLAILAGILFNRQETSAIRSELRSEVNGLRSELRAEIQGLRSEMNNRFNSVEGRIDMLHRDIRQFQAEQAKHDIRIDTLEQKAA